VQTPINIKNADKHQIISSHALPTNDRCMSRFALIVDLASKLAGMWREKNDQHNTGTVCTVLSWEDAAVVTLLVF
jgi:hypothetical protein